MPGKHQVGDRHAAGERHRDVDPPQTCRDRDHAVAEPRQAEGETSVDDRRQAHRDRPDEHRHGVVPEDPPCLMPEHRPARGIETGEQREERDVEDTTTPRRPVAARGRRPAPAASASARMPVPIVAANQLGVNWRIISRGESSRLSGFRPSRTGLQSAVTSPVLLDEIGQRVGRAGAIALLVAQRVERRRGRPSGRSCQIAGRERGCDDNARQHRDACAGLDRATHRLVRRQRQRYGEVRPDRRRAGAAPPRTTSACPIPARGRSSVRRGSSPRRRARRAALTSTIGSFATFQCASAGSSIRLRRNRARRAVEHARRGPFGVVDRQFDRDRGWRAWNAASWRGSQ